MARKLNKALLRRLARKLRRLRHEEHYDQSVWAEKTACGTAACIAGHAVIEGGYKLNYELSIGAAFECQSHSGGKSEDVSTVAARLLGLRNRNSKLFDCPDEWDAEYFNWPEPFRTRFVEADPKGPAKQRPSRVAADLLDALADGKVEPF